MIEIENPLGIEQLSGFWTIYEIRKEALEIAGKIKRTGNQREFDP